MPFTVERICIPAHLKQISIIDALNGILYNDIWNVKENDGENSSRLRFLLRQERTENPVIWASIVLAKEIYLGRKITASKLETVLPSAKFDGTKREYAVARAGSECARQFVGFVVAIRNVYNRFGGSVFYRH